MASMENLKQQANEAAQNAARTAKYIGFVSKRKVLIASEQEKIRRLYTKLGKIYYKDYVTDEEPDEAEYQPLCDSISVSFRRINQWKEEIAQAKEDYCSNGKTDEARCEEVFALEAAPEEETAE